MLLHTSLYPRFGKFSKFFINWCFTSGDRIKLPQWVNVHYLISLMFFKTSFHSWRGRIHTWIHWQKFRKVTMPHTCKKKWYSKKDSLKIVENSTNLTVFSTRNNTTQQTNKKTVKWNVLKKWGPPNWLLLINTIQSYWTYRSLGFSNYVFVLKMDERVLMW